MGFGYIMTLKGSDGIQHTITILSDKLEFLEDHRGGKKL